MNQGIIESFRQEVGLTKSELYKLNHFEATYDVARKVNDQM